MVQLLLVQLRLLLQLLKWQIRLLYLLLALH